MPINQTRIGEITAALQKKGANRPCSRCGGTQLQIVGESYIPINDKPGEIVIGGPSVPTVIVACGNCGHTWQHALMTLNLLKA